jgi:hypothetical protein
MSPYLPPPLWDEPEPEHDDVVTFVDGVVVWFTLAEVDEDAA